MMGIVGADYKFLWTSVGLSGSSNNTCTFQASHLYQNIVGSDFLPEIHDNFPVHLVEWMAVIFP